MVDTVFQRPVLRNDLRQCLRGVRTPKPEAWDEQALPEGAEDFAPPDGVAAGLQVELPTMPDPRVLDPGPEAMEQSNEVEPAGTALLADPAETEADETREAVTQSAFPSVPEYADIAPKEEEGPAPKFPQNANTKRHVILQRLTISIFPEKQTASDELNK